MATHLAYLYHNGPKCEHTEKELRFDPWLSCTTSMFDIKIAEAIDDADALVSLLPDDHRIITNEVNNKCVFVDASMKPILDGQIFRVGRYTELNGTQAEWVWEMKYRDMFMASDKINEKLEGLKKFAKRESCKLDCAELMQLLRICAIMIDCNYVDLRGGVGYFIRGLRISSGLCICGKMGGMQCGRCKKNYCSKECQRMDWPKHKSICKS